MAGKTARENAANPVAIRQTRQRITFGSVDPMRSEIKALLGVNAPPMRFLASNTITSQPCS